MNQTNSFFYAGQLAWNPQLKNTNSGTVFCPITLKQNNSSVNISVFGSLAQALVGQIQGQMVSIKGYLSSRKNQSSGYFENTLVAKEISLDGGVNWQRDQLQNAAGFQQQAQQQQGVMQQQVQPQMQQQMAPVQQNQAAHPQHQQQQASAQQQQQPPSQAAVQAQQSLYQQQQPQQQVQQQAPQQQAVDQSMPPVTADEFDDEIIPF